jgi:hypothetical protein
MYVAMLFILTTGCETLKELELDDFKDTEEISRKPRYVVTINQIVRYPRSKAIEKKIITFSGRSVWININPFLHSRHIQEIKLKPNKRKPEFYDLLLKLDRSGKIMWIALTEECKTNTFGVIVDGVFYRKFEPVKMKTDESDWVIMKGPFDAITAKKIQEYAKKNYKLLTE